MSRLKFRVWDAEMKRMKMTGFGVSDGVLNGDGPIMQFTGLLDKNGKEIYEGDVVMDPSEYGGKKTVQWNIGMCRFEFDKTLGYPLYSGSSEKCEVIGNVYENEAPCK